MIRTIRIQLCVLGLALVAVATAARRVESAPVMAKAANSLLAALTPEQQTKISFTLDDAERMLWFYTPVPRKGLPLREMTSGQRQLALALLNAGLSQSGFIKATTIMSLDEVLAAMEKGSGPRRDPDGYFFSIFGKPSETGNWGYRIDGHHLSQNFTIVAGKVIGAPSFFGTNPAEVREGSRAGLRVLSREDDLGFNLVQSLTPAQAVTAVVDKTAPADILTTNTRKAALQGQPGGIGLSALNPKQKAILTDLLDEYVFNMPEALAEIRTAQIRKAGNSIWFAWSGGTHAGEPHYYRIQSAAFLIEFDDTQDKANHIHSVWRDFEGDFGLDLLQQHYQTSHRP